MLKQSSVLYSIFYLQNESFNHLDIEKSQHFLEAK